MKYKKFIPDGIVFLYDSAKAINYYRRVVTINGNICADFIRTKRGEFLGEIFADNVGIETYDDYIHKRISYNCNFDIIKEDEV